MTSNRLHFNSHAPYGARRKIGSRLYETDSISTHTLHAERDSICSTTRATLPQNRSGRTLFFEKKQKKTLLFGAKPPQKTNRMRFAKPRVNRKSLRIILLLDAVRKTSDQKKLRRVIPIIGAIYKTSNQQQPSRVIPIITRFTKPQINSSPSESYSSLTRFAKPQVSNNPSGSYPALTPKCSTLLCQ